MRDVEIVLDDRPGALAELGEALGRAGVGIEGGGVFVTGGRGIAHFLLTDVAAARIALHAAGIEVVAEREVVVVAVRDDVPGQLGEIARRMAAAGVNIEAQYSDHDNRKILVVSDRERGQAVARAWATGAAPTDAEARSAGSGP